MWFVIAAGFKKASVASVVITVAFPVLVAVTGNSWGDILITSGLALVILARHVAEPAPAGAGRGARARPGTAGR